MMRKVRNKVFWKKWKKMKKNEKKWQNSRVISPIIQYLEPNKFQKVLEAS